jgi:CO/xanthine dehydrogenase Mo-binding subunit
MAVQTGDFKVIGTSPVRHDGVDKVTGRAQYGADVALPGTLYGKVLRSPHAHARVISIDASEAEALPGVFAVITSDDLPEPGEGETGGGEGGEQQNIGHKSANMLARDKVLYDGHAVAAVAAVDFHIADEALRHIKVEYEVLEPVLDVRMAMEPDAPVLNDDVFTETGGAKAEQPSNVAQHIIYAEGDMDAGFASADVVIEREFTTATVHQGYIETHNATAV